MKLSGPKKLIKQYRVFYLTAMVTLLVLKLFYRRADSDDLKWILAPTAWWVRILGGIPFENVPHVGYVNHELRFIIARSCSGFQFMLITAAALVFSFFHRAMSWKRSHFVDLMWGFGWIFTGFGLSYILTIMVNGLRILLSIYFPLFLEQSSLLPKGSLYGGWLTPDSLHTLIGTVVYFASLLVIYRTMDELTLKLFGQNNSPAQGTDADEGFPLEEPAAKKDSSWAFCRFLKPAFWYLLFVLGIPVLNRAGQRETGQFTAYAMLVIAVCALLLALFSLSDIVRRKFRKRRRAAES